MLKCGYIVSSPNFPSSPPPSISPNPLLSPFSSSRFPHFLTKKPSSTHTLRSLPISSADLLFNSAQFLAQIADDGPIELDFSGPSILATNDNPSNLQVATSVLLTGAITVFLFRSLRRRARRAKELKFRSSGATTKKTLQEEALESLKAMTPLPSEANNPPSPVQCLLGGLSAGLIALILYKFTTTIEASLNRQTISDNFSVRQITITVRTIINGVCYLATFIFGLNSVGLILYAAQLAFNSIMGDLTNDGIQKKDERQTTSIDPTVRDSAESNTIDGDQSSDSLK